MALFDEIYEATASDITRKQRSITRLFPTFPDRVKQVGVKGGLRLVETDPNRWHFKIHSGTEEGLWYDAILKFKDIPELLSNLVKDRRLWNKAKDHIDLRKLAKVFFKKADIQLSCSCPAFLYWGSDFILSKPKYDAKYGDPENRSPDIRNPKQYGAMCKHLQALFKTLPFYSTTVAQWLKQFYLKDIQRLEKESTGELSKIQKAAKGLRKSKPVSKARPKKAAKPAEEPDLTPEEELTLRGRGGVGKVSKSGGWGI